MAHAPDRTLPYGFTNRLATGNQRGNRCYVVSLHRMLHTYKKTKKNNT